MTYRLARRPAWGGLNPFGRRSRPEHLPPHRDGGRPSFRPRGHGSERRAIFSVEADTRARHRADQKITDARLRLIREYELIAYSDIRDVVQWDREAELDQDGNVIGFKDTMKVTPSRLLTREQAAQVKSVTTKGGALKFEVHDKLAALAQWAKVLGVAPEPQSQTVNSATVNVRQVNIGTDNALEGLKRLAFAIEKAARAREAIECHAVDTGPKGPTQPDGPADPAN